MSEELPPRSASSTAQTPAESERSAFGAWLLVWTVLLAKLGTVGLIVWASRSAETIALLVVTTWPWLAIMGALGAGPLLFRYRLRRVRARRARLQRAEWMLDADAVSVRARPLHRRRRR